jgi:hypothetical protein
MIHFFGLYLLSPSSIILIHSNFKLFKSQINNLPKKNYIEEGHQKYIKDKKVCQMI